MLTWSRCKPARLPDRFIGGRGAPEASAPCQEMPSGQRCCLGLQMTGHYTRSGNPGLQTMGPRFRGNDEGPQEVARITQSRQFVKKHTSQPLWKAELRVPEL
jgi:hypothetical protein